MSGISPENEAFINSQLATGTFHTRDQVIDEALTTLRHRTRERDELRRELQIGIDQAERGEIVSGDEVFDRLRRKAESLANPRNSQIP